MNWPNRVRVLRPPGGASQGSLDKRTGVWTPAALGTGNNVVILDTLGDMQDTGQRLVRTQTGDLTSVTSDDVTVYLKDESKMLLIKQTDLVEVTWKSGQPGELVEVYSIRKVNRMEGSVTVRGTDA